MHVLASLYAMHSAAIVRVGNHPDTAAIITSRTVFGSFQFEAPAPQHKLLRIDLPVHQRISPAGYLTRIAKNTQKPTPKGGSSTSPISGAKKET